MKALRNLASNRFFCFPLQEKEAALNMAVDVFCRIMKQLPNLAHSINTYAHVSNYFTSNCFAFILFCAPKYWLILFPAMRKEDCAHCNTGEELEFFWKAYSMHRKHSINLY